MGLTFRLENQTQQHIIMLKVLRKVQEGEFVRKGTQIGTIGTNDGQYFAHLHFELRNIVNLPIGGGYSSNTEGYLDPTTFINRHR